VTQTTELTSLRRYAFGSSLERIVACVDGLSDDELNWRPPAPATNSVGAIVLHALANAEENVLGTLCGQAVARDRENEFAPAELSPAAIQARAETVQTRVREALAGLTPEDLTRECHHPRRGTLSGREVLLIAARHAAEHVGQAELTRDLLRSARQLRKQADG
jgi:DinB superfamily